MRHRKLLARRYRIIGGYTGLVFLISGGVILSTLAALPFYPSESSLAPGVLLPGGALALGGLATWRIARPDPHSGLTLAEGCAIIVLSWLGAVAAGTATFMAAGGLSFTHAVFEATSGWTTTGLSVVDVTSASRTILLLRSVLEFAGGAGLAIIMLSALAGPAGTGLSTAEGRGEQLVPHVRRSTRLVLALYAGYAVSGVLGLRLAGMGWFDAVNHSLAAVSTGGFSTQPESIGYWDSPRVEAVTILLMILGTMNFLTAYALIRGRLRMWLRNVETRVLGLLLAAACLALFAGVTLARFPSVEKAVRVAVFEAVTALSTTGYSTVGYGDWADSGWLVLIALMIVGGGTGSTAGGLKEYRVGVLAHGIRRRVRAGLAPPAAIVEEEVWVGDRRRYLEDRDYIEAAAYSSLYLGALGLGTAALIAYGYPLRESLFEYASALGTVGLSAGITGPGAPTGVLWAEIAGMFLGRLEFFAIVIGALKLLGDGRAWLGRRR